MKQLKNWLESTSKPAYKDISGFGYNLRYRWSHWDSLVVENGIIYRNYDAGKRKTSFLQAWISLRKRRNVLQYWHDMETAAHLGVIKTLARVQQKYYWSGFTSF